MRTARTLADASQEQAQGLGKRSSEIKAERKELGPPKYPKYWPAGPVFWDKAIISAAAQELK